MPRLTTASCSPLPPHSSPLQAAESSDDSDDSDEEEEEEEKEAPKPVVATKRAREADAEEGAKRPRAAEAAPAAAAPSAGGAEGTAIFIKGLPFTSTEEEVRGAFEAYGSITEFDLPVFEDSGRLRGVARITYGSAEEATKALELNETDFGGRSISVEIARPSFAKFNGAGGAKSEPTATVFLGNLAYDCDEDTLRGVFGECGEITRVRIATDRETGEPRGFGHLEFTEIAGATAACAMAGTDINGRAVRVDYAAARPEGAGGGGGGGGFGGGRGGGRGGFGGGGRGGGRGGFGGDRGGRGGFGGGRGAPRGGRGGFGAPRGGRGGFAAPAGKKMSFGADE